MLFQLCFAAICVSPIILWVWLHYKYLMTSLYYDAAFRGISLVNSGMKNLVTLYLSNKSRPHVPASSVPLYTLPSVSSPSSFKNPFNIKSLVSILPVVAATLLSNQTVLSTLSAVFTKYFDRLSLKTKLQSSDTDMCSQPKVVSPSPDVSMDNKVNSVTLMSTPAHTSSSYVHTDDVKISDHKDTPPVVETKSETVQPKNDN